MRIVDMSRAMSRRVALRDVGIVAGACALYVSLELLGVSKRWSFALNGVLLIAFAAHLVVRRSDTWREFGFRADNLLSAGLPIVGITALVVVSVVLWARASGRSIPIIDIAILLALYPVWALVQQFVFQGVLHRRLMVVLHSRGGQVVVTACAFAAVHLGNWRLVVLTFLAGVVWSILYRRWPNLWLLALSHAVLAAVVYPVMLSDAPLSRF